MAKDFYAVLGLPRNATSQQIRARFAALAREQHPDRFQGEAKARAEEEFQAITEAFNSLFDAEKRRRHDLEFSRPGHPSQPAQEQATKAWLARGVQAYKERHLGRSYLRLPAGDPRGAWQCAGLVLPRARGLAQRVPAGARGGCRRPRL